MVDQEKTLTLITVGDMKNGKSNLIDLLDFYFNVKTFNARNKDKVRQIWPTQLMMRGDNFWKTIHNLANGFGEVIDCVKFELPFPLTTFHIFDYSHRPLARLSCTFQHVTEPQFHAVVAVVDCKVAGKNEPLYSFVKDRMNYYDNALRSFLPNNNAIIFVRCLRKRAKQRKWLKENLGYEYLPENHFMFTEFSFEEKPEHAQPVFERNKEEFERLVTYLRGLRPVSVRQINPIIVKHDQKVIKHLKQSLPASPVTIFWRTMGVVGGLVGILSLAYYNDYFTPPVKFKVELLSFINKSV